MPCPLGLSTKHLVFCSLMHPLLQGRLAQLVIQLCEPFGSAYIAPAAVKNLAAESALIDGRAKCLDKREFLAFFRVIQNQFGVYVADAREGVARGVACCVLWQ